MHLLILSGGCLFTLLMIIELYLMKSLKTICWKFLMKPLLDDLQPMSLRLIDAIICGNLKIIYVVLA